jgi:hypothetical protein
VEGFRWNSPWYKFNYTCMPAPATRAGIDTQWSTMDGWYGIILYHILRDNNYENELR